MRAEKLLQLPVTAAKLFLQAPRGLAWLQLNPAAEDLVGHGESSESKAVQDGAAGAHGCTALGATLTHWNAREKVSGTEHGSGIHESLASGRQSNGHGEPWLCKYDGF